MLSQKLQQAYANQEALNHYNRALAVCGRLDETVKPATLVAIYAGKGAVHFLLSEFFPAVESYQHMLEVARQIGDREQEAKALYWIGHCFFYAHEFEQAMQFSSEAKALASEMNSKDILAASLIVMGEVYLVATNLFSPLFRGLQKVRPPRML